VYSVTVKMLGKYRKGRYVKLVATFPLSSYRRFYMDDEKKKLRDVLYAQRDKINENENRITVLEFDLRDQKRVTDGLESRLKELE